MTTIQTIQERLETRALAAARREAADLMETIPQFSGSLTVPTSAMRITADSVELNWSIMRGLIREFLEKKLQAEHLDEMTRALISKLDMEDK